MGAHPHVGNRPAGVTRSLSDFSAGHIFEPIAIKLDAVRIKAYRDAVGDTLALYESEGVVPPLAAAALALGALLNQVGLPPGTLHVNEGLEFRLPLPVGAEVECRAVLAQRSQRAGMIVSALDSEILLDGHSAITARATVFSPLSES